MAIVMLCIYAGALLHVSRRIGKNADQNAFFVNGRASGAGGVAMSIIVSCVGASATVGVAGMAFTVGTPAFWWLGAGAVGLTILALLLAVKVRESKCYTMPEMAAQLLGPGARTLVSCVIAVAWTAILAAQFAALTPLLASLTGWPIMTCRLLGFALIVLHTFGGQAAVIRTDRIQFYILIGGLGLLLAGLSVKNPGWVHAFNLEAVNDAFTAGDLLRYAFVVGGNYLVCPTLFGRLYCAKNAAAAKRGALLAALGLAACSALIVAVGLAAVGGVPAGTPADTVLGTAVEWALPPWLGAAVLVAMASAVVSSADSCLVTSSTIMSYDLLKNGSPAAARGCAAALGVMGLLLTLLDKSVLGYLFLAYDIYVSGVVMPVFVALLLNRRKVRRPRLCLMGIGAGGMLGAAAYWGNPVIGYLGMGVSSILTLAGFWGSETSD